MIIDEKTVLHLENLARLHLSPTEREAMQHNLNHILAMMQTLDEVDVTGIEPLVYIGDAVNVTRRDAVQPHLDRPRALQNAPDHNGEFFCVSKVISKNP
jgi:aspartyl-tRNA(Asn)/glutamyl-tRNA(Gln) amidotransferase subunit C